MMRFTCAWLLLAAVGCSGANSQPKAKSADDWDPAEMEEVMTSDASGEGNELSEDYGDATEGPAAKTSSSRPPPVGEDYDITYSDCRALANVYRGAWLGPEMEKLNAKKLKPAQFEQAKAQVENSAKEASENWLEACASIADTPFPHSRLKCALKAKDLQRFDDCWDGKVEHEP